MTTYLSSCDAIRKNISISRRLGFSKQPNYSSWSPAVDLERLCCWLLLLLLLLLGGESVVVDWAKAYEGCLCRCGLGDRRDVIGMGMCICGVCVAKKRGGDRVSKREASPSCSCPSCSLARLYKGGGCALLPGCSVVPCSDHVPFVLRCHLNINVIYSVDLYLSSSQTTILDHFSESRNKAADKV